MNLFTALFSAVAAIAATAQGVILYVSLNEFSKSNLQSRIIDSCSEFLYQSRSTRLRFSTFYDFSEGRVKLEVDGIDSVDAERIGREAIEEHQKLRPLADKLKFLSTEETTQQIGYITGALFFDVMVAGGVSNYSEGGEEFTREQFERNYEIVEGKCKRAAIGETTGLL